MTPQDAFLLGSVHIDPRRLTVCVEESERSIEPLAMRILLVLVEAEGKVVTREEMIDAVWPDGYAAQGSLSRVIWSLRQALGDNARSPEFIETVPRVGYRLKADVTWPSNHPVQVSRTDRSKLERSKLERSNLRLRVAVACLTVALMGTATGWIVFAGNQTTHYEKFLKVKGPDGRIDTLHVRSETPVELSSTVFGESVAKPSTLE